MGRKPETWEVGVYKLLYVGPKPTVRVDTNKLRKVVYRPKLLEIKMKERVGLRDTDETGDGILHEQ